MGSTFRVHSDGSAMNDGNGIGSFAYIVRECKDGREDYTDTYKDSKACVGTTVNQMEMLGVIKGLEYIRLNHKKEDVAFVDVFSDSRYVIDGASRWIQIWMENGWRTRSGKHVKNRVLWEEIRLYNDYFKIRWVWVKGHDDNPMNEACDKMCSASNTTMYKRVYEEKVTDLKNDTIYQYLGKFMSKDMKIDKDSEETVEELQESEKHDIISELCG